MKSLHFIYCEFTYSFEFIITNSNKILYVKIIKKSINNSNKNNEWLHYMVETALIKKKY